MTSQRPGDVIRHCGLCGEYRHVTEYEPHAIMCRDCEARKAAEEVDDEFMWYLAKWLKKERPAIAPNERYAKTWVVK